MKITRHILAFLFLFVVALQAQAQSTKQLMQLAWDELLRDNDTTALRLYGEAYRMAVKEKNAELVAETQLYLGIASYGSSLFNGMKYATDGLQSYEALASSNNRFGSIGRNKCLVLIATIKARQRKFEEAKKLAREALNSSIHFEDSSSTIGLAHYLLGSIYSKQNKVDSSDFYFRAALVERKKRNEIAYLPTSFASVGDIEDRMGNSALARQLYRRAFTIADSSGNRQAQISVLLAMAKMNGKIAAGSKAAEIELLKAKSIAVTISDRSYIIRVLRALKELYKAQERLREAIALDDTIAETVENSAETEREHLTKSLEVQFGLSEKEKELALVKKEAAISQLTNYLLYGTIAVVLVVAGGSIAFLRRLNSRNKELLKNKEQLLVLTEQQKKLKEQQLRNELEFKESQLSAVAIQMMQKNELLQELKTKLEDSEGTERESGLSKIISKGLNQDKEWKDFNAHFEAINKNFYERIKQNFPDISPNELRICALIKMNLSSKEMAGILNISPDSVKTARYRLRKKLNLSTEENLTAFILGLN